MKIILLSLASILILVTVLPLIRHEAWWIRIFDFPRTQIAIAGIVIVILLPPYTFYKAFYQLNCTWFLMGSSIAHSIKHPSDDTYGLIFYTKLKPHSLELNYIVEDYIPSVFAVLELNSGDLIEFYCLHPNPPNPKFAEETTERDAELLIVGKKAKKSSKPVIVAGDLNDVAWSYSTKLFQKISGLLDPRIGRGFYNTFHAQIPALRFPLDHVFISKSFRLIKLERMPNIDSDHFPIYAELSYEPENKADHEGKDYKADADDKKEAEDKIDEAK